jgi:hypothetical protein
MTAVRCRQEKCLLSITDATTLSRSAVKTIWRRTWMQRPGFGEAELFADITARRTGELFL